MKGGCVVLLNECARSVVIFTKTRKQWKNKQKKTQCDWFADNYWSPSVGLLRSRPLEHSGLGDDAVVPLDLACYDKVLSFSRTVMVIRRVSCDDID